MGSNMLEIKWGTPKFIGNAGNIINKLCINSFQTKVLFNDRATWYSFCPFICQSWLGIHFEKKNNWNFTLSVYKGTIWVKIGK